MNTNIRKLIVATGMVCAAALATVAPTKLAYAQGAEYIVFEMSSQVKHMTLGAILKDGDRIELGEGEQLKLLDKAGAVIALEGPFAGTVKDEGEGGEQAEDASHALQVISKLMFSNNDLVNTLGAARSLDSVKSADGHSQPWVPVIKQPGTYCLPMDKPVFGRANTANKVKLTLISGSEIFNEKIWEEGEETVSLDDLTKDGVDRYTMFVSNQTKEFAIHLLDRETMNTTRQIAWMAERGCKAQAVQLLQEVASSQK